MQLAHRDRPQRAQAMKVGQLLHPPPPPPLPRERPPPGLLLHPSEVVVRVARTTRRRQRRVGRVCIVEFRVVTMLIDFPLVKRFGSKTH